MGSGKSGTISPKSKRQHHTSLKPSSSSSSSSSSSFFKKKKNPNQRHPPTPVKTKTPPRQKKKKNTNQTKNEPDEHTNQVSQPASASQQLSFFVSLFQSANGVQLSSLELESIKDASFVELSEELGGEDIEALGSHMKVAFGPIWKEVLCQGQLVEGKIDPGNPAVLILSTSALRSIELLRGVRSLTKECHAAKLFSKHMKVEEQVAMLKKRVNVASGTPNRVKKLIDIEALGLSRVEVIVIDMHPDVKGYSLLTLPQVRDEFWDLYKNYFHQRLVQGSLRICLFGPIPSSSKIKGKRKSVPDE